MQYKTAVLALSVAALTACGGGGSDDKPSLSFSPSSLNADVYTGAARKFDVTVTASGNLDGTVYAVISDPNGVITDYLAVGTISNNQLSATLEMSPDLAAGTYRGSIDVKLCRDASTQCQQPVAGSPWRLPYDFTVQEGRNLTPVRPLAGAGAWTTLQGNAAHNGYVSAAVDPAHFSRRYVVRGMGPVSIEGGRLFNTVRENNATSVRAIGEADGQTLWTSGLGGTFRTSGAAVSDGKVFFTSMGTSDTAFWAYDAATGAQLAKVTQDLQSQFHGYPAPTVHNGKVYAGLGYSPSVHSFDANTYALDWATGVGNADGWTPAVDDSAAYTYQNGVFQSARRTDGQAAYVLAYSGLDSPTGGQTLPVLDGQGGAYVVQYNPNATEPRRAELIKFNTAGPSVAWRTSSSFHGMPVIANGVLYVLNAAGLDARSPSTGALLWRWLPPAGIVWRSEAELVIVGNHAFVGTSQDTFAIDLTTRQRVWSYPDVGQMAVSSNGILYLLNVRGSLSAINLH